MLDALNKPSLHESLNEVTGRWMTDAQCLRKLADGNLAFEVQGEEDLELGHRQVQALPDCLS
jgi:hypothetical protein